VAVVPTVVLGSQRGWGSLTALKEGAEKAEERGPDGLRRSLLT